MTDLPGAVRAFVAAQVGVSVESLSDVTTLFGDLGVDGDDAGELMSAYGVRFGVDLSEYDHRDHFGNEGLSPLFLVSWLTALLRRGTPEARAHLRPVSIGDLIESARVGHWRSGA